MEVADYIFVKIARGQPGIFPIIVCLYTGEHIPPNCAPMPRSPEPDAGMYLDDAFSEHLVAALAKNPAVHDGAVMIGRKTSSARYAITGWSYRLYPPPPALDVQPNRGSAFNSCLAMSVVIGVDRLYLISQAASLRFEHGEVERLSW